jgi:hypothetical protein
MLLHFARAGARPIVRDGEIALRPIGHVAPTFDHRSAAFATLRRQDTHASGEPGGVRTSPIQIGAQPV